MVSILLTAERRAVSLQSLVDPHPDAHLIRSDAEAIEIARRVAAYLATGAVERDQNRRLPFAEIDEFSQSGLWGITVPKEYGGAGVSKVTLCKVVEIISEADPSIGQIPQNHYCLVEDIRQVGTEEQKRFFFDRLLKGDRTGNAFSEAKGKTVVEMLTKLTTAEDGNSIVNGEKFYCTGALFAHWIPIFAVNADGNGLLAIADRHAAGLTVVDDWSGLGQRTTASGTVRADNVRVSPDQVLHTYRTYDRPTNGSALAQIIHVAIDAGIAKAAIEETITFVKTASRPWVDAQVESAADDPLTLGEIGNLEYHLHAAEALMARAGRILDSSLAEPTTVSAAAASIAVAEAKIATTEIALLAASKLFELAGTRAAVEKYDLDRHWRNARTHTLHDPVRWKYHAIGNYYLNAKNPPRHSWI
ncbi:MAG: SfnB family sulfur acquisition oxidoreductase [Janthinobacterium lividum]